MAGRDMIVEESRRFGSCVSNQGFLFGEFELEFFLQERFDAMFDFLRLRLWSNKPKYPVIRVPTIPQAPVVRIVGVLRRKLLCHFSYLACLFLSSGPFELGYLAHEGCIWGIIWTPDPFCVSRNECVLDEFVEFIEVDIAEYGAANAALGRSA